jgi:rubrerythrin
LGDLKISQSDNIKEMLKYELKEELVAVKLYQKILGLVKQLDNSETLYHSIYHLIQDEQEHVEELKRLLAIK